MAVQTHQGTIAVNAAFLEEIKDVHQDLWEHLAVLRAWNVDCATPEGSARCFHEIVEGLAELRDLLAFHFTLEEACGYVEVPIEAAPRLSDQAYRLRDEHIDLYVQACQAAELAAQAEHNCREPSREQLDEVAASFNRLDHQLDRHEAAERELISCALLQDLGCGD